MIDFEVSPELGLLQRTARELARRELRPVARAAEIARRVPDAVVDRYLALGFARVDLPASHGGLGLGLVGRVVIEEELATGDLALAAALPSPGPIAAALELFAPEETALEVVRELVAARLRGVVAWSEPEPTPGTFSTVATEEQDGWRIQGTKSAILLGDEAGAAVVFARARCLDGRIEAAVFLVLLDEAHRPRGVRFGARTSGVGLTVAPAVELVFESAKLAPAAKLARGPSLGGDLSGSSGAQFDVRVLELFARLGVVGAARAVGVARASLELAEKHAKERRIFGRPLAGFQAQAFRFADLATRVEVMRAMTHRAAWALDHGEAERTKLAAMAIAECHEGAVEVTSLAADVLGAAGLTDEHLLEKWARDARTHASYALGAAACDLLVGRLALDGGEPVLSDAPLPELQPVLT